MRWCTEDELIKTALIIAPTTVVNNWRDEFQKFLSPQQCQQQLKVVSLTSRMSQKERVSLLIKWSRNGGVLVAGYELIRNTINNGNSKIKKILCNPGPDFLILDEGHRIRDRKSQLFAALNLIRTPTRVVLSGSPMQNHLSEYYTMVDFVRPGKLGTLKEFKTRFQEPIENGQAR